jgi:small subunit ribosomal protein S2
MTENTTLKITDELEPLFSVGAHIAYSKARRHPSAKPFIFGRKEGLDIFDLYKTKDTLTTALRFVEEFAANGKTILLVGTKPEARRFVVLAGKALNLPYVSGRWIGGTLSNFEEIKKRLTRFTELREAKENPELLEKYTKRERLTIYRELADLEKRFSGLEHLTKLPDALFIVDSRKENTAVNEAIALHIPVISLSGSDCDLSRITYPIVANDTAVKSIAFFVDAFTAAWKRGKKE